MASAASPAGIASRPDTDLIYRPTQHDPPESA